MNITKIFSDKKEKLILKPLKFLLSIREISVSFLKHVRLKSYSSEKFLQTMITIFIAPQKQYIVLLDGGVEIETSLGEKRKFQTGEILLLEDTTGKGHKTKIWSLKRENLCLFIFKRMIFSAQLLTLDLEP